MYAPCLARPNRQTADTEIMFYNKVSLSVRHFVQRKILDANLLLAGLGQVHRLSTWVQVQVH